MDEKNYHIIKLYKRSWLEWLAWLLWFLMEIFWAQNAIASYREYHARAGLTFWAIFALFLLAGAIVFVMRRIKIISLLHEQEMDDEKQL